MPRETDPFREHVKFLSKTTWNCNFCGNRYAGSATRIKAHLAGVGGYGIHGCKVVVDRVRSEALKALMGKTTVESSNRQGHVEEGPHQPMTGSNEDVWRETSFAAVLYPSSDVVSTVGANSSAFLRLPEMNLPNQSLPAQNMIPQRDFSFWQQPPQSHAGDSYIKPGNWSYPISHRDLVPKALTNTPRPAIAEEGEPNTEVPQDARARVVPTESEPATRGLANENVASLKRKIDELISSGEAEMKELKSKWKRIKEKCWSMVWSIKENRSLPPEKVVGAEELSKEVEEILLLQGRYRQKWTALADGCSRRSPLVTTALEGEKTHYQENEIYSYLMQDNISIIGVYGMGGVGKTAILTHVHNRLLEDPAFDDVFWVTVPQDFSMCALQEEIANAIGLDNLPKEKDMKRRAGILDGHLKMKKRSVIILDGLWMHFEVKGMGIPVDTGNLKLVLTTRSLDVCLKMLCQKQIKIEPLGWQDSWRLFSKTLCFAGQLPSKVKQIARRLLARCDGLPLGIIEIATHMRGVEKVHEWKGMLRKLKDSRMELDVFKRLKLSYMNLGDPQLQQCFLHLILCFGQDLSKIQKLNFKEDLIDSLMEEGFLSGIATRQGQHDEGNTILDKLRKACLLNDEAQRCPYLSPWEERYRYLHPLIRDMALHIVTSTTHMVKAYMGLEEVPEEVFWTDHLEKVFLQCNGIKEIPYGISPNCPKLTRLSLNRNDRLSVIHGSFFKHLKGLKVLDISETGITELPNAICQLESLEALLLRKCWALHHIPCVGKLGFLRKLDLRGCEGLEEVPQGMELLVKLRYLDLVHTKIKMLPEGMLEKLVNLQYLGIEWLRAGEEEKLKKVEALCCGAPNVETFNACMRFVEQNSFQEYHLGLNVSLCSDYKRAITIHSCNSIAAWVDRGIVGDGCALLPRNVQFLAVEGCSEVTNLYELGPLDNLEVLEIDKWGKLEELGAVHFPHLQRLIIFECSKLKHLLEGQGLPRLQWLDIKGSEVLEGINIVAPSLQEISVTECPKMKRVVEWEWLTTRLPKLENIIIHNCEKLEEVIGGPVPIGATCLLNRILISRCNNLKGVLLTHDMLLHLPFLQDITVEDCEGIEVIIGILPNMTHSSFPNLRHLSLLNLPELKSVCDGTMSCSLIEHILIGICPKLKRISLQLPLLDNGLPSPPPSLQKIWINQQAWESLEWDHPLAPSSLERIVRLVSDFHDSLKVW